MSTHPTKRYPGINLVDCHESEQCRVEVSIFGFWVFMMSDLILFGLMFAVYITMIGPPRAVRSPRNSSTLPASAFRPCFFCSAV